MISLPVVTEAQVTTKLKEFGYSPTDSMTATARFWRHNQRKRHLMVPFSADGFYPDWLLEEVAHRARAIGDDECAEAVKSISPWERLRAAKDQADLD
jgi:hypothetical protein